MARTAKQAAALRKAQLASAKKRRKNRNGKIDKKIDRVAGRGVRKVQKHAKTVVRNSRQNPDGSATTNRKGYRSYKKINKTRVKTNRKIARLQAKKR